ncbi:MAG: hypothetical protein K2G44_03310 [Clostridia bacterium]|nr:hypothetical protein [Clostridia bacterium]
MAKESTTVQCYPSDEKINKKIKEYESFGWEVTESQRVEERTGTYYSTTYHLLTFTREKNNTWYKEVTELEKQYHEKLEKRSAEYETSPDYPKFSTLEKVLFYLSIFTLAAIVIPFVVMICCEVLKYYWIFILIPFILIASIIGIIHKHRIKKYNAELDEWHALHDQKLEAMQKEADKIAEKASEIVNA